MKTVLLAMLAALVIAPPATAQDRITLGFGRLFTNDALGDGRDRWRTGSYQISWLRGTDWTGDLPATPGQIVEYRFRGEIVAPSNLRDPDPADRRYAGMVSFGVHTHFAWAGMDTRVGFDLVGIGPSTGVGGFHREMHELFSMPSPAGALATQLGDSLRPTLSAEIGRSYDLGGVTARPFLEAQAGVETLVRAGGDLSFGRFGQGGLMLRDTTTGQRIDGIRGDLRTGLTATLGGDVAHVLDSALLPDSGAARLRDTRARLRAGLHWQGDLAEVFYGVTWLGREYRDQPDDQMVGSLRVNIRF